MYFLEYKQPIAPVANAVAKDVPFTFVYPPCISVVLIFTPGAEKSIFPFAEIGSIFSFSLSEDIDKTPSYFAGYSTVRPNVFPEANCNCYIVI